MLFLKKLKPVDPSNLSKLSLIKISMEIDCEHQSYLWNVILSLGYEMNNLSACKKQYLSLWFRLPSDLLRHSKRVKTKFKCCFFPDFRSGLEI